MVTMQDISLKAGVSKSTVSHILNGRETALRISDATRDRVLEAAHELGYRLNSSARAMSRGSFGGIALLQAIPETRSFAPQELLDGIYEELARHDWHLMLSRLTDEQLCDESVVPKILREWLADGLLIDYIDHIPARLGNLIARAKIPAIWMNSRQEFDCVFPDDFEAATRATRFLLELGHTKIAYVDYMHNWTPGQESHYSAHERIKGYQHAMRDAHLTPRLLHEPTFVAHEERLALCQNWLSRPDRPSAVLCYGTEASVLIHAAALVGLRVPRDLSVMNFGAKNENFCSQPMTSMLGPFHDLGRVAVQTLHEKILAPDQKIAPRQVSFGFQEGVTTAPAP